MTQFYIQHPTWPLTVLQSVWFQFWCSIFRAEFSHYIFWKNEERTAVIDSIYFFYSFGFIAARVAAVSLYSATLNEAARRPVEYLYSLPTENYTLDVSRLITQINYMQNGITGHGFFLITKNFLLQAAATVITFELMIFQFAPSTQNKYNVRSEAVCIK
ncbi:gustatory receptor for sugar taste 64f-like [Cylas formicarius]|uniref:gustatory receptor for sugar taste 64f-like n=1 Tax=Cylas formicarius TaxID=197179 RepID=UPI00295863B9|nr:gustatory receptor for sugar taste 64f-like [Cylas formicarius]